MNGGEDLKRDKEYYAYIDSHNLIDESTINYRGYSDYYKSDDYLLYTQNANVKIARPADLYEIPDEGGDSNIRRENLLSADYYKEWKIKDGGPQAHFSYSRTIYTSITPDEMESTKKHLEDNSVFDDLKKEEKSITLSDHRNILEDSFEIKDTKDGKYAVYTVKSTGVNETDTWGHIYFNRCYLTMADDFINHTAKTAENAMGINPESFNKLTGSAKELVNRTIGTRLTTESPE